MGKELFFLYIFNDPLQHYSDEVVLKEISKIAIGREEVKRCGNEGVAWRCYEDNEITYEEYKAIETTKRILRAARAFIPDAQNDGADMKNAVFILSIPGRDFVIKAGKGDWEYVFEEEEDGVIYGRCVRQHWLCYTYDKVTNAFGRFFSFVSKHLAIQSNLDYPNSSGPR